MDQSLIYTNRFCVHSIVYNCEKVGILSLLSIIMHQLKFYFEKQTRKKKHHSSTSRIYHCLFEISKFSGKREKFSIT